jgi:3-mercaptopyruvate sulfurtransferase SseA
MKMISMMGRGALLTAATLIIFACSKHGAANNQANAAIADPSAAATPVATPSPSQNPEDKMPRVTADELKKQVADGKAVVIDVRGADTYKMSHIKGALDVPLTRLEAGDFKGLPKDKRIVAYCT